MKILFLFSKYFPYGQGEQYIENELPYLAPDFDEVWVYPTDHFGTEEKHNRVLPANARILDLNNHLKPFSKDFGEILSLVTFELRHSPRFFSEVLRTRYLFRIALHQAHTARNFHAYLKENCSGKQVYLYSYWAHNNCVMLSALKKKKLIDHFVTRAHSIDLYYHDWALAHELKVPSYEYTKFNYASHIYTISKHGEKFFKTKFPRWQNKVSCSYLGVSDLGINEKSSETFTMVTCSNLSSNKRLIELAKAIKKMELPLRWVHFGDGEQRSGIEEIAATLPSSQQIELKGHTANDVVRKYLVHSPVNVFVNLSQAEGLPVALMEAISAGIPVIATQVYGNPEIAVDGQTGFIIPADFTTDQLIAAIRKIYDDQVLQQALKKGARQHYLANFNDKDNYARLSAELLKYPNLIN